MIEIINSLFALITSLSFLSIEIPLPHKIQDYLRLAGAGPCTRPRLLAEWGLVVTPRQADTKRPATSPTQGQAAGLFSLYPIYGR